MLMSVRSTHSADSATHHPLGPIVYRYVPVQRAGARRRALLVAAACAAILALALWVTPDSAGYGTHRQLGLFACSWPQTLGIPCPTCGMTTAFACTVRARWLDAFRAQPLGLLLALLTIGGLVLAIREAITLRAWRINWHRIRPAYLGLTVLLLALAGWCYKILAFRAAMR